MLSSNARCTISHWNRWLYRRASMPDSCPIAGVWSANRLGRRSTSFLITNMTRPLARNGGSTFATCGAAAALGTGRHICAAVAVS